MNMNKIFMSYSWKDKAVAMRLYDDLTRSHLQVWRDQIDGDPTADFKEEFLSKIDECDDFIILDSENYRNRSNWCTTEIERCFENQKRRNGPRVIVCLLDKDGQWRYDFKTERHRDLFSKVNMFKYQELYYDNKYDNENVYQQSIMSVCQLFGEKYIPWNVMPETRDLHEELIHGSVSISNEDRQSLLNSYANILNRIRKDQDVTKHFELWMADCEELGLDLFFPRWTFCVWLGQCLLEEKRITKCHDEFKKLVEKYPEDPRSHRGFGCICAFLGDYSRAKQSFHSALKLISYNTNNWHRKHSEYEVLSNLSQVYINLDEIDSALDILKKLSSIENEMFSFQLKDIQNYNRCLCQKGLYEDSIRFLKKQVETNPLLGELYSDLGVSYMQLEDDNSALNCFEKAYTINPNMENCFYVINCLLLLNKVDKAIEMALQNINKESVNSEDNYWKGAICYYALNDISKARHYYSISEGLYDWYS